MQKSNAEYEKEKIYKTEDALLNIQSYTKVALGYANNYMATNSEIFHLSLLLNKIDECINDLGLYYEILKK